MNLGIAHLCRSTLLLRTALGAQFLIAGPVLLTQGTGSGSPPPTYDYDANTPGVQGPTSPLLAGYTYRSVRTYQFTIPVLVDLSDLTYLMPPGFTPVATQAGSTTAQVNLSFFMDQRFQTKPDGPNYGPTSAVLGYVTAVNSNLSPSRQELVFTMFEAGSEVDALNAAFGAGSARLAHVNASVTESGGLLRYQFDISDPEIGLRLRAKAECPATVNTRATSDPVGLPFRTTNGLVPNNAFRATSRSDTLSLTPAAANVTLTAAGNHLHFPTGAIRIKGIGSTVTFNRGVEFFLKFE